MNDKAASDGFQMFSDGQTSSFPQADSLLSGKGYGKMARPKWKERIPAEHQSEPYTVAAKWQIKDEITQLGEIISEVNISLQKSLRIDPRAEAYQATREQTALHHR